MKLMMRMVRVMLRSHASEMFAVLVVVVMTSTALLVYKLDRDQPNIRSSRGFIRSWTRENTSTNNSRHSTPPSPIMHNNSRLTIFPGDVIPEETALTFLPCEDISTAADAEKSVILAPAQKYKQGDIISISINLYDGNGRPKTTGGDQLRARIFGGNMSIVAGTVFDHDNGSYTAQFEALFVGEITLDVMLAYTRETISSLYRIRKQVPATRGILARFDNEAISEATYCNPVPERLPNTTGVCNLTYENSGVPWYCGKPNHPYLMCRDWTSIKNEQPSPILPYTNAEVKLLQRKMKSIPNNIIIRVEAMTPNVLTTRSSLVPCTAYNTEKLWYRREPTGYLDNGQWKLRHCQAKSLTDFKECLRDKSIIIFGDSTTRHWFQDVVTRFSCEIITEPWNERAWHKPSKCANKNIHLNVSWIPHSQPFFSGSLWNSFRYTTYSMARYLDEMINNDDDVIVLLHMYMHALAYRHEVFQTKVRLLRQSVERLLARNKHARVFIKGPHTLKEPVASLGSYDDYQGFLYWNIWFHEFKGLYDRVVYLDNKDMTITLSNTLMHPSEVIVSAMVDQMFSYIC